MLPESMTNGDSAFPDAGNRNDAIIHRALNIKIIAYFIVSSPYVKVNLYTFRYR